MGYISALRTFFSWSLGAQVRLLIAMILLTTLTVGFHVKSFSWNRRHLLRVCDTVYPLFPGDPTPAGAVSSVKVGDRVLPGSRTCLMRSLTAEAILRLYGVNPEHRIGVKKDPDQGLEAHSWLEFHGEVLIGDLENLAHFEPLPSLDVKKEL